jgi:cysteine-rich repeat protein
MHRSELRIASLFIVLAACNGDPIENPTGTTSETGETTSTSEDDTTKPPTTDPTTTDVPTDPSTDPSTDPDTSSTNTTVDDTTTDNTTVDTTTDGTTTDDTTTDGTTTDGTTTDETTTGPVLCGNAALDDGEACDGDIFDGQTCMSEGFDDGVLACAADCTLDTSGCTINTCGNGAVDDGESCDGDDLFGEDCVTQGFMGGTLLCAANCGGFDTGGCFVCGNDLIDGADVCDGTDLAGADCASQGFISGELACAVDCSAYDTTQCVSCGNDAIDGADVCDGTDLAGETCASQGFVSGELACAADCTDFDTAACETCGNNVVDAPEVCDGGDFDGASCADMGLEFGYLCCGLGCDGVTADNCADELLESEPNDDGMTAINTNDFSAANADGPIMTKTVVRGSISPNGDDDVYAVTNPTNAPMILTAELNGANGPGTCPNNDTAYDTVLEVRSAANMVLATDDDGGIGYCSRIANFTVAANTTVYLRLIELGDNTGIANYHLTVDLRAIACGDGHLAPTEGCDDGNLVANDGCSATCTVDSTTAEVEPNATSAEADANGVVSTGDTRFAGAISANNDLDRYLIDLAAPQFVRVETFTRGNDCLTGTTTTLRLFNSNGVAIISDTTSGIQSCSAMTFPLPMGKSYVQVEESGLNAQIPAYLLDVQALADVGMESEPNDNQAGADTNLGFGPDVMVFGDHTNENDTDVYAINVPTCGSSLRLEIIEGDRAVETCEGFGVDSFITLKDSTGKVLEINDDDGRGFCSLIDGTGTVPVHPGAHGLAAGTYFVEVTASPLADGVDAQFIYRLAATVRKP